MYIAVAPPSPELHAGGARVALQRLDADGTARGEAAVLERSALPAAVAEAETGRPRWIWAGTRSWYPELLAAGVTVDRCWDLGLSRAILATTPSCRSSPYIDRLRSGAQSADGVEPPRTLLPPPPPPNQHSLFEEPRAQVGPFLDEVVEEFRLQMDAVEHSRDPRRLNLLIAAESAGALIAGEMEHEGLPWRRDVHEELLESMLGPRPPEGGRPAAMERLAAELRAALGNPGLNPDSPQDVLRALHRAGIEVKTTRSWELEQQQHPAVGPLLAYKKLSRLLTANGWTWLDTWIHDGRFRPEYVVGGVVSGRWASRGGGALQIPRQVRDAVRADEGHVFVVADAAQLEPRVLAALGRDSALAAAARGRDLYQGIADQGFGGDRAKAKLAMLGAMYGATSGESGRLMPQLTRSYPDAIAVVEVAARAGEAGDGVSSHLGRGCPPASEAWRQKQRTTTAEEQRRADGAARARGRFTRNFVVQASAAEWALCWLAEIRRRLAASDIPSPRSRIAFFLHDEVVLHVPAPLAAQAETILEEAARAATRLIFGDIPLEFAISVVSVTSYADAK
ncbi:bifunctional 3'-5' exonuclease/DNA polymerase [Arthrobacter agilis]|uniref:bifunctional 3'-5' exonuclease/DNA polymerase n=1 Tax=Arthrobacter agilis TaxID=37921 RepID=UPI002366DCD0|nr:bifunctional 3'-5' exonuclease/DNA polymerase [Arthrobacter agilis]WDF32890.1 bifunctional 3'-5' exonuclease/DNA polymerase [Arthrobacter agilis]